MEKFGAQPEANVSRHRDGGDPSEKLIADADHLKKVSGDRSTTLPTFAQMGIDAQGRINYPPIPGFDTDHLQTMRPVEKHHLTATQLTDITHTIQQEYLRGVSPGSIPNVVRTADELTTARVGNREQILQAGLDAFHKANPQASPGDFSTILNRAFDLSPNSTGLRTAFAQAYAMTEGQGAINLYDIAQGTPENPRGLSGSAVTGTNEADGTKGVEAAKRIKNMMTDAAANLPAADRPQFIEALNGELNRLLGYQDGPSMLATNFPDTARKPGAETPSEEQQLKAARDELYLNPSRLADVSDPEALVKSLAKYGNDIAFAKGSEAPSIASKALEQLFHDNPNMAPITLGYLLASAANFASGSKDYRESQAGPSILMYDKRMISPTSKSGLFASVYSDPMVPIEQAAARSAVDIAAQYRRETKALPQASAQDLRDFISGIDTYRNFMLGLNSI